MTEARDYLERRWWALALLCMTQFMVVLDASIVNIALPSIGDDVGISQENLSWVVNGYVLTFGGFLLLGGRMADLLGRRRIFMAGLVIVAVASLFAGFAPNEGTLIAARAAQGLGAAIIAPSALSIVTTIFRDGSERNKALGAWGAVAGSGGAAGVLLGGVLTDGLGWEWVMWVNVPVALIVLALTPQLIPESRSESQTRHFDLAGAVTVTAGVASQLVTRIGFKPVLAVGLVLIAAGVVWFSQISVGGGFATDILGPSLLAAVGLGFAFVTTTIAAVSGIQDHEQGLASGLINTSQQIGGALGLAVLATIANSRPDSVVQDAGGDPAALPRALVEGFQSAFLGAAVIALVGLALTFVLIRSSDSRAHVALSEKEGTAPIAV